jgi:hypothetical protein
MQPIIERVLFPGRRHARAAAASSVSSSLTTRDIETYYLRVIGNCLRRMLVADEDVEVRVRRAGTAASGLTAFAAYVRILRWDPIVTPVLLQNIPVIDARIRKVVSASVLLEQTHFAGLWFQAASSVPGAPSALVGLPTELKYQSGPAPVGAR